MKTFLILCVAALTVAAAGEEKLTFHTDWKGERIELPPSFAPAMTLKGIEEIRFAPGMFNAKSESFFTYAFVFSVPKTQELTPDLIKQEMLAYYRGLAEGVSKSKGKNIDGGKFTFALEPAKAATETPQKIAASTKVAQYSGELSWIEPFVTAQPQLLHFELQSWTDPATARNYLFVCASPRARGDTDAVWKELHDIRRSFEVTAP
ncbi:MAG TPA: hypothetical protein VGO11_01610 [Chthoniobacteraceae bacterium]|nr:hypothetical protein [Chthoniobacteraceae bacterium]